MVPFPTAGFLPVRELRAMTRAELDHERMRLRTLTRTMLEHAARGTSPTRNELADAGAILFLLSESEMLHVWLDQELVDA